MSGDGRSGAGRGGKKGKRTAARPTAKSPPATPGAPAWQLAYRRKIRRLGGLGTDARPDAAYDSSCFECNDGGEVVCCATCNRVCHPGCMSPPRRHIPDSEEWKCGQCLRDVCAVCGETDERALVPCDKCKVLSHVSCQRWVTDPRRQRGVGCTACTKSAPDRPRGPPPVLQPRPPPGLDTVHLLPDAFACPSLGWALLQRSRLVAVLTGNAPRLKKQEQIALLDAYVGNKS